MIRTGRAVAALLVAGGLGAVSSCGATARDAATIDGASITIDDYDRFTEQLVGVEQFAADYDAETGALDGQLARGVLGLLITNRVAARVLADNGEEITDADREVVIEQSGDPTLAELPVDVQQAIVDSEARQAALGRVQVSEDELRERYERRPADLWVFCARHVLTETEAAAEEALAELEDGAEFASVATDVSIDPTAAQTGGALLSPAGESCFVSGEAEQTFDPTFFAAAAAAVPGSFVGPVETSFGWHVIEAVPYDEAAASIASLYDQYRGLMLYEASLRSADIDIDPRYGSWDPVALTVVAAS